MNIQTASKIAVVIPAFRVKAHVLSVIEQVGKEVWKIYVVDDCCPEKSGAHVEIFSRDPRVCVLFNEANMGVGGAVIRGYRQAMLDGADIVVKVDGDNQMDPCLVPEFIAPIVAGEADYTKGNRFYDLEKVRSMPNVRLFGNALLSLLTKLSSGYWQLFDPTNGFTAIHVDLIRQLPFDKISPRYFFETDMLFRLNTLRAVVVDIPMEAKYGDEVSNLKISKIVGEFLFKHFRNFSKRIFYNYYLRDLSLASIELPIGLLMLLFGLIFGGYHWVEASQANTPTPAGTVMLAALPILMGLQLVLAFIGYDIAAVPRRPRHRQRHSSPETTSEAT